MSDQNAKCPVTTYALFTDLAMTTPFTNTPKIEFASLGTASLANWKIYTDTGFAKTTIYLNAYTVGKSQANIALLNGLTTPLKINILVCGSESLSLTAAGNVAQLIYEATPNILTINKYAMDFKSWFQLDASTSHPTCGITRYWLGGCLSQYSDTVY